MNCVCVFALCVIAEQVATPVLTVEPVLSSGDMTVTCITGELFLKSTCKNHNCAQKVQTASTNLTIFRKGSVIICNHSNSVSWSHATVEIEAPYRHKQCKTHPFCLYDRHVTLRSNTLLMSMQSSNFE